jgi:Na+-transporting methylmalonyl-CoA/oxaloacetate decarboxylase gamma subunit
MGIVFIYLLLSVYKTQRKILEKLFLQETTQPQAVKEEVQTQTINVVIEANAVNTDAAKIAAVIAAVQHHKGINKRDKIYNDIVKYRYLFMIENILSFL